MKTSIRSIAIVAALVGPAAQARAVDAATLTEYFITTEYPSLESTQYYLGLTVNAQFIGELQKLLDHESEFFRSRACMVLGGDEQWLRLHSDRLERLLKDESKEVRYRAIRALANAPAPGRSLASFYETATPDDRENVVRTLPQWDEVSVANSIMSRALADEDPGMRYTAAQSVPKMHDKAQFAVRLAEIATGPSAFVPVRISRHFQGEEDVAEIAATSLIQCGECAIGAVPVLKAKLEEITGAEDRDFVRRLSLTAMIAAVDPGYVGEARAMAEQGMRSENAWVQLRSLRALKDLEWPPEAARDTLLELSRLEPKLPGDDDGSKNGHGSEGDDGWDKYLYSSNLKMLSLEMIGSLSLGSDPEVREALLKAATQVDADQEYCVPAARALSQSGSLNEEQIRSLVPVILEKAIDDQYLTIVLLVMNGGRELAPKRILALYDENVLELGTAIGVITQLPNDLHMESYHSLFARLDTDEKRQEFIEDIANSYDWR